MKEMVNRVKKHNRKFIKFQQSVVIFICYYTCYLFLLYDMLGKFSIVGGIGVGIMALDVGRYFIEQYLQIDKPIVGTTELYELMRYHAFDENSYFSEIFA